MDRLTIRLEDQWGNPTDSIILKPYMRYEDEKAKKLVLNRLASYEDTGLTPQEIEQMKARMPLHQWAGESPEKMSIFGIPVKKIMEWAEAEKNNICKRSDTEFMASWEAHAFGSYYTCTNCQYSESHGYPARDIRLGKFCPNCGLKMSNPRYVSVEVDYD